MNRIISVLSIICALAIEAYGSKNCKTKSDVGFIVDSSGSMKKNFRQELSFVKKLAESFGVSKSGSHMSVIDFSSHAHLTIPFNRYYDLNAFNRAVDRTPLYNHWTRMDRALYVAKYHMFSVREGARRSVPRILFFLTDGTQTTTKGAFTPPATVARLLEKQKGVKIIAVGMGKDVKMQELRNIAGNKGIAYQARTFRELLGSSFLKKLTEKTCAMAKAVKINGRYGPWSHYSKCSKTCGSGTQFRTRKCDNPKPANGGRKCTGSSRQTRKCNIQRCPVNGHYGAWTSYTKCSKTCGKGVKTRTRKCNNPHPKYGGKNCVGLPKETKACKDKECPVNGKFGAWTAYSKCSKTCGKGLRTRTRKCSAALHGGKECKGAKTQTKPCHLRNCPVDGKFGAWTVYTECSKTCGEGVKTRTRKCDSPHPKFGGKDCVGSAKETESCKVKECPVHGKFEAWTAYSACSKTCGEGVQTRTRKCSAASHGGKECEGPKKETKICHLKNCPVDGKFGAWGEYTECSKTCGEGVKTRTRKCDSPYPKFGGKDCVGLATETKSCKDKECPVDGKFGSWSKYSECSTTCGEGVMTRSRKCNNPAPAFGGKECVGDDTEQKLCNEKACPVDGHFGAWSKYSECSKTCGKGVMTRTRNCNDPAPAFGGKECVGVSTEEAECNHKACPVNGGFGPWTPLTSCSRSCGEGVRLMQRSCNSPKPAHGGRKCSGKYMVLQSCVLPQCQETAPCAQECKDDKLFCNFWARLGQCQKFPRYMLQNCKKSCGNCPRPASQEVTVKRYGMISLIWKLYNSVHDAIENEKVE